METGQETKKLNSTCKDMSSKLNRISQSVLLKVLQHVLELYCRGPPYASTQCYIVGNRCTNGSIISDLY